MVTEPNPDSAGVSRRRFLLTSGVIGAGALGAGMPSWAASADPGAPTGYPPSNCGSDGDTDSIWQSVRKKTPQNHGAHQTVVQPDANKAPYVVQSGNETGQTFKYNLLFIPAERVTGLECSKITDGTMLNLWPYAFKEAQNAFPGKDVIAGINSYDGRTKQQLHIHLTLFYEPARKVLDKLTITSDPGAWNSSKAMAVLPAIPRKPGDPQGAFTYRIMYVRNLEPNIFISLQSRIAKGANDMFAQSLAVVSAPGPKGGYYLINTQGKPTQTGQPAHVPPLEINKVYGTQTVEGLFFRG
jgi:CDP-diacylglycerol pyrophosphatase